MFSAVVCRHGKTYPAECVGSEMERWREGGLVRWREGERAGGDEKCRDEDSRTGMLMLALP
mgnify:CR=1 FL=1